MADWAMLCKDLALLPRQAPLPPRVLQAQRQRRQPLGALQLRQAQVQRLLRAHLQGGRAGLRSARPPGQPGASACRVPQGSATTTAATTTSTTTTPATTPSAAAHHHQLLLGARDRGVQQPPVEQHGPEAVVQRHHHDAELAALRAGVAGLHGPVSGWWWLRAGSKSDAT
jgi:hypothetical protein